MEDNLYRSLFELEKTLQSVQSPLLSILSPGISDEYIENRISEINISLPESVYQLFNWRNGIVDFKGHTLGESWLFPLGMQISLDESIKKYKYYIENDDYWDDSMFMLFESGGGEMYLIDCASDSETYGMIFKHWLKAVDYDVIITVYDSLSSLVATVIDCYKKGIFYLDVEKRMLMRSNFSEEIKLAREYNPKSRLWRIYQNI